jgi:hypothetical protein
MNVFNISTKPQKHPVITLNSQSFAAKHSIMLHLSLGSLVTFNEATLRLLWRCARNSCT